MDTMDRPPDVPPRPPEAIIDLSHPPSWKSASKIYHFFMPQVAEGGGGVELAGPQVMEGVEVLVGVGVGPLGQEEVAVGLDIRG
jgi:hypothetical protein